MKNIFFFIGMPGTGKTFWGEKVSASFGYDFVDLDWYIEEKEGKNIASIFADDGEDHFRRLEQQALHELVDKAGESKPLVIACGGGTPCFLDNLHLMLQQGTVVYLRAALDTLVDHLCREDNFRPLLEAGMMHEKLYHLMEHRVAFYEQAHYIVDVENLSVATFGEIIHSHV